MGLGPLIVGIDPGFTGAIAFLGQSGLVVHDMPVFTSTAGKTAGIDLHSLAQLLSPEHYDSIIAVLENVGPHPKDGKDRVFKFGRGLGNLEMAVAGHGYEVHWVTPATWKKHFRLTKDKGCSRKLACQRFPDAADSFARVKDHGRAEAALLALYGAETILGRLP